MRSLPLLHSSKFLQRLTMTEISNRKGLGTYPMISVTKYFLTFTAVVALQGCGNVTSNSQVSATNPATAEGGNVSVPSSQSAVELSSMTLFKVVDGQASPLADGKLDQADGLRVMIELAGNSERTALEVRVADTKGNGVFRDKRILKVDGKGSSIFDVPSPKEGWQAGNYLISPVINDTPAGVTSFLAN